MTPLDVLAPLDGQRGVVGQQAHQLVLLVGERPGDAERNRQAAHRPVARDHGNHGAGVEAGRPGERRIDPAWIVLDVDGIDGRPGLKGGPGQRLGVWQLGDLEERGGDRRIVDAADGREAQQLPLGVVHPHQRGLGAEQADRRVADLLEDRVAVGGGGDVLGERAQGGELPRPLGRALEQVGVVDGQRGLVGEELGEPDLVAGVAGAGDATDREDTDHAIARGQRHGQNGSIGPGCEVTPQVIGQPDLRIGHHIGGDDRPAILQGEADRAQARSKRHERMRRLPFARHLDQTSGLGVQLKHRGGRHAEELPHAARDLLGHLHRIARVGHQAAELDQALGRPPALLGGGEEPRVVQDQGGLGAEGGCDLELALGIGAVLDIGQHQRPQRLAARDEGHRQRRTQLVGVEPGTGAVLLVDRHFLKDIRPVHHPARTHGAPGAPLLERVPPSQPLVVPVRSPGGDARQGEAAFVEPVQVGPRRLEVLHDDLDDAPRRLVEVEGADQLAADLRQRPAGLLRAGQLRGAQLERGQARLENFSLGRGVARRHADPVRIIIG